MNSNDHNRIDSKRDTSYDEAIETTSTEEILRISRENSIQYYDALKRLAQGEDGTY